MTSTRHEIDFAHSRIVPNKILAQTLKDKRFCNLVTFFYSYATREQHRCDPDFENDKRNSHVNVKNVHL